MGMEFKAFDGDDGEDGDGWGFKAFDGAYFDADGSTFWLCFFFFAFLQLLELEFNTSQGGLNFILFDHPKNAPKAPRGANCKTGTKGLFEKMRFLAV